MLHGSVCVMFFHTHNLSLNALNLKNIVLNFTCCKCFFSLYTNSGSTIKIEEMDCLRKLVLCALLFMFAVDTTGK